MDGIGRWIAVGLACGVLASAACAQEGEVHDALRALADGLVARGVDGVSIAVVDERGALTAVAAGRASRGEPLTTDARMLVGSTGKTFVTAVALQLAAEDTLDLDAPVATLLDDAPWLDRVPNARLATTRQLLNHTAGMPRYVFAPAFTTTLTSEPDRHWRPEELLAFVHDVPPRFAPGEGFGYADTHYLVVGLVIEALTGRDFYDVARERLVVPLALEGTVPVTSRRVDGLAQGHVVLGREMGVGERAVLDDGRTSYNVQFEWCGGGWASTPSDLARWAGALYGGDVVDAARRAELLDGVDAPELGPGARYGLGVTLRDTRLGELRGHDGFMPGYLTTLAHFPAHGISVAVQMNRDDPQRVGRPLHAVAVDAAACVVEGD